MSRFTTMTLTEVYPLYRAKVERKGRTEAELREVVRWYTGLDDDALDAHLDAGTTFPDLFAVAPVTPLASAVTGSVCGVRVQDVEDPLVQHVRRLDKLVDELAKGRPLQKVLRTAPA